MGAEAEDEYLPVCARLLRGDAYACGFVGDASDASDDDDDDDDDADAAICDIDAVSLGVYITSAWHMLLNSALR